MRFTDRPPFVWYFNGSKWHAVRMIYGKEEPWAAAITRCGIAPRHTSHALPTFTPPADAVCHHCVRLIGGEQR